MKSFADIVVLLFVASSVLSIGMQLTVVLIPALNVADVLGIMRSRGLVAGLCFVALAFVCGYSLSPTAAARNVIGLATASRNIPAALLIGTQNFHAGVTTMIIVLAILSLVVLLPITFLYRRSDRLAS